jgi:hypothetical protein
MTVKKIENETAIEARYQFYKETTQVDPVTGETVTLNVKDEWAITLKELEFQKANFDARSAEIQTKIDQIKSLK